MRYVQIDLSSDNHIEQSKVFGGYAGEHRETILQVKLPERMTDIDCSGYKFSFQTPEGNKIDSPLIPISELSEDIISFYLTNQLTIEGNLLFNVLAITLDEEDITTVIAKTNTATLCIKKSADGNNVLFDPSGYKDEIIAMVDDRISEIAPWQVDQTYDPTSENAQSGTAVAEAVENLYNAVMHRNIFRGKNLGASVTAAQKAAIQNGTFADLYIGDYWEDDDGVQWTIADMDYWYNTGDTAFTQHHLVVMPYANLYYESMNDTSTTVGGYAYSEMRTTNLDRAKTMFADMFGDDMILTHREYLINAATDGHASAGAWFDSTVDLMSEIMVYGCMIKAITNNYVEVHTDTNSKQQLSIFRLKPDIANIRAYYWLRDITTRLDFALVTDYGRASQGASGALVGVRPVCAIG